MNAQVLEKWRVVCKTYFSSEIVGEELLEKFILDVICSQKDFQNFFDNVSQGSFHQHYESHFIHMPINVIEDEQEGYGKYEGCVKIAWNNFNDQNHVGLVRLDKFCFYVQLAAVFHAKYVDQGFDPWERFKMMDEMQRQYLPYPTDTDT